MLDFPIIEYVVLAWGIIGVYAAAFEVILSSRYQSVGVLSSIVLFCAMVVVYPIVWLARLHIRITKESSK